MSANTSSLLQRSHLPFGRVFRSPSSFASFSSSCRSVWSRPVATAIVPPLSSTSSRLPSKYRYHSSLQSTPTTKPIFAENVNPEQLSAPLQSLLDEKQWILDERRMGVAKTYYFKTYTKSLDFVQVVGIRCKSKNHHPTITLKSGSVHVHWTTHFPRGLTQKDIDMAQYCDQQAALIGTVQQVGANRCKPASTP